MNNEKNNAFFNENISVVGINYDGEVKREEIKDKKKNDGHASATRIVAKYFGFHIDENAEFLDVPLAASNKGILIMQFIPNPCIIFFPSKMTSKYFEELEKSVNENNNIKYIYVHNNEIYDEIYYSSNEILDIASNLIEKNKTK